MKNKFLMAGAICLFSATAFAQKSELSTAQSEYDKYETLRQNKSTANMAATSLTTAKTSIDKASANEKTANLPQTYALKGAIYGVLAYSDTVAATSTPLFNTAAEAVKKAKETDTKGEYKKLTDAANQYLAYYQLNKGVKEFQGQKFEDAYKSFDAYRTVYPEDTTAIFYTGLAAANSKNYPAAIAQYKKLVTTNYSKRADIYADLSNIYLMSKDTTAALNAVSEGVSKFPNSAALRGREVEIALQQGKQAEFVGKIEQAIATDPKNKTLYFYSGVAHGKIAEASEKAAKAAKDPAAKAAALKTRQENLDKAAAAYQKAVELDPNYFDANLNMGYVLMTPAVDDYNTANKLPQAKQKEYNALMAKVTAAVDKAKPYLEKAVELDPKSAAALGNLRNYYIIKKDNVKTAEIKKKIDALQ
ncbi:tetratricopeptide repeat protein [Mucilaginibacter daejeonensis]|uniref:tetratricopeptide repeat protein n=1 Tax=Mucilaginibacter daejeonensis TaxID=398049 RepID=UPI001D171E37|nr:tetratricopeptide repeat protein [Mucilaginibacter daejeonensis]UEG55233.1 tetratricopeptide repeat protein [Mucilaginibacter daejeonensis]